MISNPELLASKIFTIAALGASGGSLDATADTPALTELGRKYTELIDALVDALDNVNSYEQRDELEELFSTHLNDAYAVATTELGVSLSGFLRELEVVQFMISLTPGDEISHIEYLYEQVIS